MFKKSLTFKAICFVGIFYALLFFPPISVILHVFLFAIWPLFLGAPHLITIALIFDVKKNFFSRKILFIPLAIYFCYYVIYIKQAIFVVAEEKKVQAENAAQSIEFNPKNNILIFNYPEGPSIISQYQLPVVYTSTNVEIYNGYDEIFNRYIQNYISHRLIDEKRCKKIQELSNKIYDFELKLMSFFREGFCDLAIPEDITGKDIITVSKQDNYVGNFSSETTYTLRNYKEEKLAEIKDLKVNKMLPFPLVYAGCFVLGCKVEFITEEFFNSLFQNQENPNSKYDILANLLKLKPRSAEIYQENSDLADKWINIKKSENESDLNWWGIRKDSIYIPKISFVGDVESYEGEIFTQIYSTDARDGEFYNFIERNNGKVVLINANLRDYIRHSFVLRVICNKSRPNIKCDNKLMKYLIKDEKGNNYLPENFDKAYKISGYFLVSHKEKGLTELTIIKLNK